MKRLKGIPAFVFFSLLFCLPPALRAQYTSDFLTNGLVAYFPFNGLPFDLTGNSTNFAFAALLHVQDRFGATNMAYQFNGSNSFFSVDNPSLPTGAAPRTVSLWAKAQPTNQAANLIFWGNEQNGQAFGILNNGSPYTWQGESWGGGDDVDSGVIVDTNWHNVVAEYDGTSLLIFVDGVKKGMLGVAINTGFSTLEIGGFPNTQKFSGAINEVRIYNRALSDNEVQELYQSFTAGIVTLPTITVSGITNQTYSIQYVTNVSATNWTTLISNIVLQTNQYLYTDTNALNQPRRFYRVVAQ